MVAIATVLCLGYWLILVDCVVCVTSSLSSRGTIRQQLVRLTRPFGVFLSCLQLTLAPLSFTDVEYSILTEYQATLYFHQYSDIVHESTTPDSECSDLIETNLPAVVDIE